MSHFLQPMPIISVCRSWPMQINSDLWKVPYMWWQNYRKWPMCHKNNWHTLFLVSNIKYTWQNCCTDRMCTLFGRPSSLSHVTTLLMWYFCDLKMKWCDGLPAYWRNTYIPFDYLVICTYDRQILDKVVALHHLILMCKGNNIVAAFRGMHVLPAKHSYAWLPRKCDYRTDRQTPDKVIPMCPYNSHVTQIGVDFKQI